MALRSGGPRVKATPGQACSEKCGENPPSSTPSEPNSIRDLELEAAQPSSSAALPDPEVLGGLFENAPGPARARARPRGTPAGGWILPEARPIVAAANMAETNEEVAVLVQRVVKDITNAFRRNPHM